MEYGKVSIEEAEDVIFMLGDSISSDICYILSQKDLVKICIKILEDTLA